MTEDSLSKTLLVLNESIEASEKLDELLKMPPIGESFKPSPVAALFAPQREVGLFESPSIAAMFARQMEAERQERQTSESLRWACEAKERRHAEMVADALARKLNPPEPLQPKTSKEHELHAVIRRAFDTLKLPAADLWNELKNPEKRRRFDPDGVIQSMDRSMIHWKSWREERTQLMKRRTFNNFISKLKT